MEVNEMLWTPHGSLSIRWEHGERYHEAYGGIVPYEDLLGLCIEYRSWERRAETVHEKPAFRAAFRRRRCLVPVNGWFEWRRTPAGKAPYWISLAGGRPFSLAGLWEAWGEGGARVETFTVLTCPAGEALAPVHDRQPVVLAPEDYGSWLAAETPAARVQASHPGPFALRRVGALVNNARNDVPEVVRAVDG